MSIKHSLGVLAMIIYSTSPLAWASPVISDSKPAFRVATNTKATVRATGRTAKEALSQCRKRASNRFSKQSFKVLSERVSPIKSGDKTVYECELLFQSN